MVEDLGNPNQRNLFSEKEKPSVESVFEGAVKIYEKSIAAAGDVEQIGLFNENQRREDQSAARQPSDGNASEISQPEEERTEESRQNRLDSPHFSTFDNVASVYKGDQAVENLVEKLRRLKDNAQPEKFLFKHSNARTKDEIFLANPHATEFLRRVVENRFGQGSLFGGAYFTPSQTADLIEAVEHFATNVNNPISQKGAHDILRELKNAVDTAYKDLIIVAADNNLQDGWDMAVQEEKGHRAITRAKSEDALTVELSETPSIKKSLQSVERLYSDFDLEGKLNEVIAKNTRDDAQQELNITREEQISNFEAFFISAKAKGIDLDNLANQFENVSPRGKEFADYVRKNTSQRQGSDGETYTGGTGENGSPANGLQQSRETGDGESIGNAGNDKPDRFTRLQPREVSEADRSGILVRTGKQPISQRRNGTDGDSPYLTPEKARRINSDKTLTTEVKTEIQSARLSKSDKMTFGDYVIDTVNIAKSLKSTMDLSAAGRQGWILTLTHPLIARKAFWQQLKSLKGKNHQSFVRDLNLHSLIEMAEESGLFLSNLSGESSITEREEAFMSRILGDDRFFKNAKAEAVRRGITYPTRAAERAYTTYLDSLRINTFELFAKQIHQYNTRKGIAPSDSAVIQPQMEAIADFINNATGRGDLGKFNDAAPALNAAFFSARYWKSRLQMMNPAFYLRMPKGARGIAMKNLAGFAGATAALMLLYKLAGGEIEWDDPNDPDTLKIKLGNYSYDITGGMIGHLRYIARMAMSAKDKDPGGQMLYLSERYVRSKLAPVPGAAWNSITGKNFIGEPTDWKSEAVDLPKPLMVSNFIEAAEADGSMGLIKVMPEFFGVGATRYKTPAEIEKSLNKEMANLEKAKTPEEIKAVADKVKTWGKLLAKAQKQGAINELKKSARESGEPLPDFRRGK